MGLFDFFKKKPDTEAIRKEPGVANAYLGPSEGEVESELVPLVGRIPFPAYRGNNPYIFISYAHANANEVFRLIKQFHDQGYNVWYDEGIAPGNEWTDEIANALENAALFLVFLTPESEASTNVRDEINYALNDNKPFLAIHLAETKLTGGLKLRVGTKQAILKYAMSDEEFLYKYTFAFEHLGLPVPPSILKYKSQYSPTRLSDMVSAAAVAPASDKSDSQAGKKDKPAATVPLVFRPEGTVKILTTDGSLMVPANSLFSAAAASIVLRPLTEWNDDKKNLPDYKEILKLTVEDFEDDNTIHKSFHITKNDGTVINDDVILAYDSRLGFCENGKAKRISWRKVNSIEIDRTVDCMQEWGEYARIHMRNGDVMFVPAFSLTIGVSKRPQPGAWSYSRSLTWPDEFRTGRGTQFSLSELSSISFGEVTYDKDKWEDKWIKDKELPVGLTYKDGRRLRTTIVEDYLKLFAIDDFGVIELMPDKIDHIAFVNDIAEEVFVETPPGV